jgi:hypothetical protein
MPKTKKNKYKYSFMLYPTTKKKIEELSDIFSISQSELLETCITQLYFKQKIKTKETKKDENR